jgi:predicted DNA-binding transcriptional regulator AlpA
VSADLTGNNEGVMDVNLNKISGTPDEVEKSFGLDAQTLANWRCQSKGPKYRKIGRRVIYVFADVQEWLDRFIIQTTESITR